MPQLDPKEWAVLQKTTAQPLQPAPGQTRGPNGSIVVPGIRAIRRPR